MNRLLRVGIILALASSVLLPVGLAHAVAQPDLAPTQIIASTLYPGVANQITVLIGDSGSTNLADFTASSFDVTLQANGAPVGTQTVSSTQAFGWPAYVNFTWTPATAGAYTLLATADSTNVISESNEANNTLSLPVQVLPLAPVTVNVRVEGRTGAIWSGPVTFQSSTITDNTGQTYNLNHPTAIGALDAASRAGGFSYVATNTWGSLFVTTVGGDTPSGADGWQYRVGWVSPSLGAADYSLGPNDHEVLWYYGAYGAQPLKLTADKTSLYSTDTLSVTVEAFDDFTSTWSPVQTANVHAGSQTFSTDVSGLAHFSLSAGYYTVYADKGDYTQYTRSNQASIQVRSGGGLPGFSAAWRQFPQNPAVDLGTSGSWNESASGAACVIQDGATYKMWFTGFKADGTSQIGYATSTDSKNWSQYPGNPVMTPGASGTWDELGVGSPWVVKSGSVYKMWYTGYALVGGVQVPSIGYATSGDGLAWTPYGSNPVIGQGAPASFTENGVLSPSVILDGAALKMWYTGRSGGGSVGTLKIGYAESIDGGTTWTPYAGNPVLSPNAGNSWEVRGVGPAAVIKDGSTYYMWYTGTSGTGVSVRTTLNGATSNDGKSWTESPSNPEMSGNAGTWTAMGVGSPCVLLQTANLLRLWYSGIDGTAAPRIGVAYSVDLDGKVILQGGSRPPAQRAVPVTIKVFTAGANVLTDAPLATVVVSTQDNGTSSVSFPVSDIGVPPGAYDLTAKTPHSLLNVKRNVAIAPPNVVNLGTLLEGNANDDNQVTILDFSILAASYLKSTGQAGYDVRADFDISGQVNTLDFSLLASNYLKSAPINVP